MLGLELRLEERMLDRLRRVTDLFVEGTELPLGMDENNKPVVVWINKLNSFEIEEARRDGVSARGLRLLKLAEPDNPERMAVEIQLKRMSDQEVREARVAQMADELYLGVINDLEADEEWSEKVAMLRRLPELFNDSKVPADDPRRKELDDLNVEYLEKINEGTRKKQEEALRDLANVPREDLEADYLEAWRNRVTLDDFIAERRMTEMFMAVRDCKATEAPGSTSEHRLFDHEHCDHSKRLLNERSQVRTLPEPVLEKISNTIDQLSIGNRESGNSAAPASSSGSSEPSSAPEADSKPSTPAETPPVAPTT